MSEAKNTNVSSPIPGMILFSSNDLNDGNGKVLTTSDVSVLKYDNTTRTGSYLEILEEEVEKKIKKLYWTLQTGSSIPESVELIGVLFGFDVLDGYFVQHTDWEFMNLIYGLSVYVIKHDDFLMVIRRLRHLTIEHDELRKRILEKRWDNFWYYKVKGSVEPSRIYHFIIRIFILVDSDLILIKIMKTFLSTFSSYPLICDIIEYLFKIDSNVEFLRVVQCFFFWKVPDKEFSLFIESLSYVIQSFGEVLEAGEVLFSLADPDIEFIEILKGRIDMVNSDTDLRETICAMIYSGRSDSELAKLIVKLLYTIDSDTKFAVTMKTIISLHDSTDNFDISELSSSANDKILTRDDRSSRILFDMNYVIEELGHQTSMTWNIKESGSYYSNPKNYSGTFDKDRDYLMWPTEVRCRIDLSGDHPCYCRVFVTNREELPLAFQEIFDHNDELPSSKFKDYVFRGFDSFLEKYSSYYEGIEKKINKKTSPAYTMREPHHREFDLVPCLLIEHREASWFNNKIPLTEKEVNDCHVYVVPKSTHDEDKHMWRISFSSLEMKIIQDHFSESQRFLLTNLKFWLRVMQRKEKKLSSYHITTLMLNQRHSFRDKYPHVALIEALKMNSIPHFFIPKLNLLQDVEDEERELFITHLEKNIKISDS